MLCDALPLMLVGRGFLTTKMWCGPTPLRARCLPMIVRPPSEPSAALVRLLLLSLLIFCTNCLLIPRDFLLQEIQRLYGLLSPGQLDSLPPLPSAIATAFLACLSQEQESETPPPALSYSATIVFVCSIFLPPCSVPPPVNDSFPEARGSFLSQPDLFVSFACYRFRSACGG